MILNYLLDQKAGFITQKSNDSQPQNSAYSSSPQSLTAPSSNILSPVSFSTPMIASNKSISSQTLALAHILQKRNFTNSVRAYNNAVATANKDDLKKSNN